MSVTDHVLERALEIERGGDPKPPPTSSNPNDRYWHQRATHAMCLACRKVTSWEKIKKVGECECGSRHFNPCELKLNLIGRILTLLIGKKLASRFLV